MGSSGWAGRAQRGLVEGRMLQTRPFTLPPALSQDFRRVRASPKCCCRRFPTWSRVLKRSLSAHKAPALPDCRRPWCTSLDTSSWEAFFRRSGLWRYRLGSAPKRDNQAFGIPSALAWTLPIPDHNSATQPSSRGHKTPELPPLPSSILFYLRARGTESQPPAALSPSLAVDPQS